jgi:Na+-transporting methylmalonyl-CoA/oxaloacetate decarboxylase gamma subunit
MSPMTKIFLFLLILMVLVFIVYITVVRTYYWWGRGTPPPTGDEKRKRREEELKMRAKQIEHSKNNPIATRNSDFWDNSKVYRDKK